MGLALEWMTGDEREALANDLLGQARKRGRRLGALCPFHSEKTPSFSYHLDRDFYKCYGCGGKGDLIKLYAELRGGGRDTKEVFLDFKARYGPEDQPGERKPRRRPAPTPKRPWWEPYEAPDPPELWMEKAGLFVEHAQDRLWGRPRELAQLWRWGLTPETAVAGRLGWNDRWKVFPAKAWGLGDDGDPDAKIKLPPGLVIPLLDNGRVIRIKIRRPEPDAKPRYLQIRGSSTRLYLYGRGDKIMIVETERDALMLWGRFAGLGWAFVGTGSASAPPCARLHPVLSAAGILAVSLDTDQAGAKAWDGFWSRAYPRAFRWPVPRGWGKDPGEAFERGHDLGVWLRAAEGEARGG